MNNSKFKIKGIALSDMDTISEFIAQDNKIAALK